MSTIDFNQLKYVFIIYMGYLNGHSRIETSQKAHKGERGVGLSLTADEHYHLNNKRLTNVSVNLWDRFHYYDNDSVKYEASIDMNGKDITGVNKITTDALRILSQINMKSKKIVNLGNGTANSDAVNKSQLDAVETQVTTVNEGVTQNKTDIATINTNNGYYYFTDQLKHDNSNTVKFPRAKFPPIDSYPFSRGSDDYKLRIRIDGYYHIIYTDFYTKKMVNLSFLIIQIIIIYLF